MFRALTPPASSVLDLIGNTPMVELTRIGGNGAARIFAKLDYLNPGGSVKDRLGLFMIRDAEKRGVLKRGGTIIEPTAGNTGIGLALAGTQLGYRVMLVVPANFSVEKQEVMRALGGEVVLTAPDDGMRGAIAKAEELARSIDGGCVLQQFRNKANSRAHYETTGPEIWEQMQGDVDAWVAGSGTGGTFSGTARFLKEKNPQLLAVCVEPQGSVLAGGEAGPHDVEGIGSSFIPEVLETELVDRYVTVVDPPAFAMVGRLAREEGILGGSSAGANVEAALRLARELGPGKKIVTIIPDASERYLSKGIFSKWKS